MILPKARILLPTALILFTAFGFFILSPKTTNKELVSPVTERGQTPTKTANPDQFIPGQVVEHGSRQEKKIALTFDADMTPGMIKKLQTGQISSYYNQAVIDLLEKEKIPATLFITGLWAQQYPRETQALSQNSLFEIGNHSYSHPAFAPPCYGLPPVKDKEQEYTLSQQIIHELTGLEPVYFRFPGGCYRPKDLNQANEHRFTVIGWDVDSEDAFNPNVNTIIKNVKAKTQAGSILVFHLNGNKNAPQTAPALEVLIPYLKQHGFTFVKVSQLLNDFPKP